MAKTYPQQAFPYAQLIEENQRRGRKAPEYELLDSGVFAGDEYFDVTVEYAKADPEDLLILITLANRGARDAHLDVLPTLWFRNTWRWGYRSARPQLSAVAPGAVASAEVRHEALIRAEHATLGTYWLICEATPDRPELLFTDNETNHARLYPGSANGSPFVKDGINDHVVRGASGAVNPELTGTKAAARYRLTLAAGETRTLRLRLTTKQSESAALAAPFDNIFAARRREADAFYATVVPPGLSEDARNVQRQALAGLLWSKQFYNYNVLRWLRGDPAMPSPPAERWGGRNRDWKHLNAHDVLSMPDKWEYPWFAAWDLAFHCIPFALVDADFAKQQLILLLREWYMHPNGQLPA